MPPKKAEIKRSGPLASANPEMALNEITSLLDRARGLKGKTMSSPEFKVWEGDVKIALSRFYGSDSEEYSRFDRIWFQPGYSYQGQPQREWDEAYQRGLEEARLLLESRKKDWESQVSPPKVARAGAGAGVAEGAAIANSKDVFVVHGHDHGIKETVARFLSKVGLNPIILHEQPDEGKTIIEKFEKHAEVSFAVAIFSKDDLGVTRNETSGSKPIEESLRPRARQNIVLELGYFMGALGRKNVRAIVEDGVETPSDYSGVLFIPFDAADGWRLKLVKELKAAGLDVDANAAF
jgi:predicted nucleotide-binding protein